MTICIGALCDSAGDVPRALVLAADRMVTWGHIEFQHEIPKGSYVAPTAFALTAGDALRGARLIQDVRARIPASGTSLPQVAEVLAQRYAELRMLQVQTEVLTPRGLTLQQYYSPLQGQMMQPLIASIDQQMAVFDFNLACLLGGVDDNGAHIYMIINPGGQYIDFGQIGFAAIGIGDIHAIQSLIGFKQTRTRSLRETLFNVYASKRRAEAAPGVGEETDLWIVRPTGIEQPEDAVTQKLEGIYQEYQRPASNELKQRVEELPLSAEENGDTNHE